MPRNEFSFSQQFARYPQLACTPEGTVYSQHSGIDGSITGHEIVLEICAGLVSGGYPYQNTGEVLNARSPLVVTRGTTIIGKNSRRMVPQDKRSEIVKGVHRKMERGQRTCMATQLFSHRCDKHYRMPSGAGNAACIFRQKDCAAGEHEHSEAQVSLLFRGASPSILTHSESGKTIRARVVPESSFFFPGGPRPFWISLRR
jgi:hypothetical protein